MQNLTWQMFMTLYVEVEHVTVCFFYDIQQIFQYNIQTYF